MVKSAATPTTVATIVVRITAIKSVLPEVCVCFVFMTQNFQNMCAKTVRTGKIAGMGVELEFKLVWKFTLV